MVQKADARVANEDWRETLFTCVMAKPRYRAKGPSDLTIVLAASKDPCIRGKVISRVSEAGELRRIVRRAQESQN